jgi:hypothetical protein
MTYDAHASTSSGRFDRRADRVRERRFHDLALEVGFIAWPSRGTNCGIHEP